MVSVYTVNSVVTVVATCYVVFTYVTHTLSKYIREDRVCKECGKGKVEDVEHWLLRCEKWRTHRQPLMAMVQEHYEVDQVDLAAVVLYLACRNYKVLSCISYMWHTRFNELLASL